MISRYMTDEQRSQTGWIGAQKREVILARTLTILAFLFVSHASFQAAESRVTVQCELDTEFALTEISVSVEEKREVSMTPEADGELILHDLPEGDLHLLFYRRESLLGRVEVSSTRRGDFIRLVVRLVEGNAILLDESRVRGVSEVSYPGKSLPPSRPKQEPPPSEPSSSTHPTRKAPAGSSMPCPAVGDTVAVEGRLVRLIDNDSFELLSGRNSYVIYMGKATRLRRGSVSLRKRDLQPGQVLSVEGRVAAGPRGECSIGARQILVKRRD